MCIRDRVIGMRTVPLHASMVSWVRPCPSLPTTTHSPPAGDYRFKASGYTVTFDGFTALYLSLIHI